MHAALDTVLRRPRAVLTLMLVMVVAGIWSYVTIAKEADPDVQVPVFYVSATLAGISPEDAERLLLRPIEAQLRGLDGLKTFSGTATEGHVGVVLEFDAWVDLAKATADVRESVNRAKAELPADADEPTVHETNLSLRPTLVVALSGSVPERTLYAYARQLQEAIERVPSVVEVKLVGQREELLEVVVDPQKLDSYGLSHVELVSTVQRHNRLVAAGAIDSPSGRFNVKVPGLFETPEDVASLPIKVSEGVVVTLGEVADIRRGFKDRSRYATFNGRPAITVEVMKRHGANIIETNDAVKTMVDQTARAWPAAIRIDYALDRSRLIGDILSSLQSAILLAIILVMILVVAALGLRSGFMVGLAIPSSFMIGFLLFGLLGFTVNIMLLFGLVVTVGMLVDGSIVLTEFADRKMAEGHPRQDAYIMAAQRMFWPIVSSTLTTLAAFLPLLFWPGVAGKFIKFLPLAVVIVLSASLLTAMIFLPTLGTLIGRTDEETRARFARYGSDETVDLSRLGGIIGLYLRFVGRIIRHPLKVILAAALLVTGIVTVYVHNPTGVKYFVDIEPEQVLVFVRARGNLSSEEKLKLVRQVERTVAPVEGIRHIAAQAGTEHRGVGLGTGLDVPVDVIGQLLLDLEPVGRRAPWDELKNELRRLTALPGISTEVREVPRGPRQGKDIRLQVIAHDRALAYEAALEVRRHMEAGMTGLVDIEDEAPLPGYEWVFLVDREEAGRFGADVVSVGTLVQMATMGALIGTYRPDDARDEIDIRIRLPQELRSLEGLAGLKLLTPPGLQPLSNFVVRRARPQIDTLYRTDGHPSVFVKANAAPEVFYNDKVGELDDWLKSQAWPDGVSFRFRGADEEQKDAASFLQKALVVSLFVMFMILIIQFNSFYYAALTLLTVVLSIVGVLIGMLITGQYFSIIMTGTGVVALAGVVVNNSIVLIDTYQRMLKRGMHPVMASMRTAAIRMRPVVLTTATTILGLMPMMFEVNVSFLTRSFGFGSMTSSWWVQMSTTIVSGLAFAAILTLILNPVLLAAPTVWRETITDWHTWLKVRHPEARFRSARSAPTHPAPKRTKPLAEAAE
jgi:multidrug efflux pump